MNFLQTRRILTAMVIADILVFGGWVASEELHRTGEQIKLPVEGYDPRDLLSGHYVRFRLIAAREAEALTTKDTKQFAVCLDQKEDGFYHVTRTRELDDHCTPFLAGKRDGWRIDFGIERFYVDERIADEVRWVEPGADTYLIATIDSSGEVHAIDLVVNGNSLRPHR